MKGARNMSGMDLALKRLDFPGVFNLFTRTVSGSTKREKKTTSVVPRQSKAENLIKNPITLIDCRMHGKWLDVKTNFKSTIKAALKNGVYVFRRVRESLREIMHTLKTAKSKPFEYNFDRPYDRPYDRISPPRRSFTLKESRIWELIPICAIRKLKKFVLSRNIHFPNLKEQLSHRAATFKKPPAPILLRDYRSYRPGSFGSGAAS